MGEKFEFIFTDTTTEVLLIQEPFGYDAATYNTNQDDKRLARDVLFTDGSGEFRFGRLRRHYLDKLLFFHSYRGFESKVQLKITDGDESLTLDLDFQEAVTDGLTYFNCKLIQDSDLQRIKRRNEIKVNVLSDKDLDGNPIAPLVPENILIKPKSVFQQSTWKSNPVDETFIGYGQDAAIVSPFNILQKYDILDSTIPFENYQELSSDFSPDEQEQSRDFATLLKLKSNNANVQILIKGLNVSVVTTGFYVQTEIKINYGTSYVTGEFESILLFSSNTAVNIVNQDYSVVIPFLPNTSNLWITVTVFQPYSLPAGTPVSSSHITVSAPGDETLSIKTFSSTYNTVTPSLRLYDIMRYMIQSVAGLMIVAPDFEPGGRFYDQRLFNGNFLRNLKDRPFYFTLKQLQDTIIEFYADMEIQPDRKVFFGLYPSFYRDEEMAFLTTRQFDKFVKGFNPKACLQSFNFGYKNFQSQKENTEPNNADGVHGETEWLFANNNVENVFEIKCEAARDAAWIDSLVRKSITVSENTATNDDDKIAILDINVDAVESTDKLYFTETSAVLFTFKFPQFTVQNDGSFSWVSLGLTVGSLFLINSTKNDGYYTIASISPTTLVLLGGGVGPFYSGEDNMNYTYYVPTSTLVGVNWTNEGINPIDGIASPDHYSNLRFTAKRNILNFFGRALATANLYHRDKPITNTFYKNNPLLITTYNGVTVKEGADFTPTNPILSPVMYKNINFLMSFAEFVALQYKVRTIRGYIRAIDNEGFIFKFYPKKMNYNPFQKLLSVAEGEEKYEPLIINIAKFDGYITINDEYTVSTLNYDFREDEDNEGRVLLKDQENQLLYNPIFWHRVGVNGNIASSLNELKQWLSLLN